MSEAKKAKKRAEPEETPGFSQSMDELTAIVQSIEDDETDIDGLAAALHRASELLEVCRGKIRKVDLEVSQIVQRLDGGAEPSPEPPADDD